jgi:hypothetical protein
MKLRALVALAAFASTGCGSSGGSGGGQQDGVASGVAVKGPVADATVAIHELRATGTVGAIVGSGTSNAAGEFDIQIPDYLGLAVVRVTGGTFVDEATGAAMTIGTNEPLEGFVDVQVGSIVSAITPVSTITVALMQYFAHDPEATIGDNVANAFTSVARFFGLTDIETTIPADLTAGPVAAGPAADIGIVSAGISWQAQTAAVDTMVLVDALAADAGDGRFDGKDFGVDVPLGAGVLSPTAGTTELAGAIAAFLASSRNASGLDVDDTLVDDELAASSGILAKPIQIQALSNGYGLTSATVEALLRATILPPSPQVLIEAQVLSITSQSATELGFEIPSGLAAGSHDLIVNDLDTGVTARLRDAVEVFDPDATPAITDTAPPAGPLSGGTFLRIRGTNFGPSTEVEIDGVVATRLAYDFPRWIAVATPPHAEGSADVTVRNGSQSDVATGAFAYRSGDTRANPSVPSQTAPIVFSGFRNYASGVDGLTVQAFHGRSTFTDFDSGSFTLNDYTATAAAPTIATRSRGGSTFQGTESLGKALLFFDAVNGISDFVRCFTNEENGVSMGATAFGPACVFPEPSGMQVDTVAKCYWVNAFEVNIALGSLHQKTGWLELDTSLRGSANLFSHGRDYAGTDFDLGAETWIIGFTLGTDGSFDGTRTIGSSVESLSGQFSAAADLGFLVQNGTDGTLGYYLLTPIEHGIEAAGWGGWVGGYLQHEIADDGLGGTESAFESGSYRGLISTTGLASSRIAFNRASRVSPSDTEGGFSEYVGAVELAISPSGRIFKGDDLAGYISAYSGILLGAGEFPNECLLDGGLDLRPTIGGAVFRHSRKSFLSLEPQQTQIAIEAKLLEGGPVNRQQIGTDLFDVALDPNTPPTVSGVSVDLAGTIPTLEGASIAGIHKSTVRDTLGAVTTTRGAPPPWGVETGYSFIDDILDLYVTEITQPGGRFDGASLPRWIGSGSAGNDGEVASLRGNDEFLGDALIFMVADRGLTLPQLDYEMRSVGLSYEPNEGGLSNVTSTSTELSFLGNGTVDVNLASHTQHEDGSFTSDTIGGLGLNTMPGGQQFRINIPNGTDPDREWEGVLSPSGDAFYAIDDSPSLVKVEFVVGIRLATTGSFAADDRSIIGLELNPQISRATTHQLSLTPVLSSLLTGEIFTSVRLPDGDHLILAGQSFVATSVTEPSAGTARVAYIGQLPVLNFLFKQNDEAAGQEDLLVLITPRILHSVDR